MNMLRRLYTDIPPENTSDKIYQVNLQELAERYAWAQFKKRKGFFHRKKEYIFEVLWGHVEFTHKTKEHVRKDQSVGKTCVLYSCQYENKTDVEQTYTVSASRQTTSTSSIQLERAYTIGAEINLKVNLGFGELGGGLNGSLSVTKLKGEEFSETLTWNIDTEVKVKKRHKAKAQLVVQEMPIVHDFTVITTMSLMKNEIGETGNLPICIRRKKDNSEIATYFVDRLDVLFEKRYAGKDYFESGMVKKVKTAVPNSEEVTFVIDLMSNGVSHSKSWANQHIEVTCEPL